MPDLFWPGAERAGDLFDDGAFLRAMVRVESAWLAALVDAGIAPRDADDNLSGLVGEDDVADVAADAESGGNPVIPLLAVLRHRLGTRNAQAAEWVHRGLTSQDVLDTALMMCAREVLDDVLAQLDVQVAALARLADEHRGTVMAGRTLTQHAVPVTFGLKAAQWLTGVLDARTELTLLAPTLTAQLGGAAGTLAATCELARLSGRFTSGDEPAKAALAVADRTARSLGLRCGPPWHSTRTAVTRLGDALVRAGDAWGRVANDVLVLARPEIAELAEPAGRGSSSTMPNKANPVLSVLLHRAALAGPASAAQLHLAAASAVDERPDGAWHVEWSTLATLCRRTAVAAAQASELLGGLRVDAARMAATARAAAPALLAEQRGLAAVLGGDPARDPEAYLGATDLLVDAVLDRARADQAAGS